MRRKMYWKKIAVILMTTALLLQGQVVLAAETENVQNVEVQAAPETEAPQTEAPQTEAPQTEAPQTEAPQTEAPQTEAPQTEAPQTEAPQTEAPQTEAPQTKAPQTEAPQTEAPQTEAPQTEAPQTEAPQTEAPETEAPQTEAPETEAPQTEAPVTEAPETEAPKQENTKKEETAAETESETEAPVYKTSFRYEDTEVVVTATASEAAKLPENTEMKVEKLKPGTPAYEAAKNAAKASLGSDEDAEYVFYDVTFSVNGQEIKAPDGTVSIQIQFKTIQKDDNAEKQNVLHIDDAQTVKDVTAPASDGSNMSSVNFAL